MNKYTELSDFEINKKVAEHLKLNVIAYERIEIVLFDDMDATPFDPCNNVEQAWEIMMKYNICVTRGDDGNYDAFQSLYCAGHTTFYYENCLTHKKPLVAVCLCFLEINK